MNVEHVEEMLREAGYTCIGSGTTRSVWTHPWAPGWVTKVDLYGGLFNKSEHRASQAQLFPAPRTVLEMVEGVSLLYQERVTPLLVPGSSWAAEREVGARWEAQHGISLWALPDVPQVGLMPDGRLVAFDLGDAYSGGV